MRFLTCLFSRRNDMPEEPDNLTRLRKAHYSLEDLPETIAFPSHPAREVEAPVALEQATIDEVAFAIIAAEQESSAAHRRSSALQRLYKLAREAGGNGTDGAVDVVVTGPRAAR